MTWRTTVENCRAIDVNDFNRGGYLTPGAGGTSTWTNQSTGEEVASIGWFVHVAAAGDGPALRLFYTVTKHTDESRDIEYRVPIEHTPCHFGGERPWFICPGEGCGERVGKLYKPPRGDYFLCRHCYDLGYESRERQGGEVYEYVTKPHDRLKKAIDELKKKPPARERLYEVYEAKRAVRQGLRTFILTSPFPPPSRFEIKQLPPFEEWADDLFHRTYGSPGGRPYGYYGRCKATAKTTGERCRQPAIGEHGKCYYHGGAPGAGAPEGNQNAAIEAD